MGGHKWSAQIGNFFNKLLLGEFVINDKKKIFVSCGY